MSEPGADPVAKEDSVEESEYRDRLYLDLFGPGRPGSCLVEETKAFIRREITAYGVWYYGKNDFADMVGLVRGGLPVDTIATHEFPLGEAEEAYDLFANGRTGKVILTRE